MKELFFMAPACSRVRYRRPIFPSVRPIRPVPSVPSVPSVRQSVRPSVNIYADVRHLWSKLSILINYKTKQPSKPCMKHLPDPPDFANIGVPLFPYVLSIRPSVCQHLCRCSTFYVKVSILINYKTKQPSNLA